MFKCICLCHLAQEETTASGMKCQLLANSWKRHCGDQCRAEREIQQLSVVLSLIPEPFENKADPCGTSWVFLAPAKLLPRWSVRRPTVWNGWGERTPEAAAVEDWGSGSSGGGGRGKTMPSYERSISFSFYDYYWVINIWLLLSAKCPGAMQTWLYEEGTAQ